jgi:hypothetical protein
MGFAFSRHVTVSALLASALLTWAAAAQAAEPTFPTGSRLGLVPPAGLTSPNGFRGFLDRDNNASILLIEMPSAAFPEIEKTMTAAALKKQGVVQEKRETIAIRNGKGFLIIGRQEAEGVKFRKWILVADVPQMTALVTAQIPDSAKGTYPDATVRTALASLITRETVPIDEQLGLLPYKLDDLAGFRVAKVFTPATALLTEGPKDDIDAVEQPHLVVAVQAGSAEQPSQREVVARNFFAAIPGFTDMRITGAEMLRLSGQQVHQIMADAKEAKSGKNVRIVQWVRFGTSASLHIVGIAPIDGWSDAFPRFRAVRDNVSPKTAENDR